MNSKPELNKKKGDCMRCWTLFAAVITLCLHGSLAAGDIVGQYVESRSCDVYTGPCFGNAEMDLGGKEAVLAWRIEDGRWNGVSLAGRMVAVVAQSEKTMGDTGVFAMRAGRIRSVILVDEAATAEQRQALVGFVQHVANALTKEVVAVRPVAMSLERSGSVQNGQSRFVAQGLANITTRAIQRGDCVCTNEDMFYRPFTKIRNVSPSVALVHEYTGADLGATWTLHGQRSAYAGTFRF
jgi:hypothetical protein